MAFTAAVVVGGIPIAVAGVVVGLLESLGVSFPNLISFTVPGPVTPVLCVVWCLVLLTATITSTLASLSGHGVKMNSMFDHNSVYLANTFVSVSNFQNEWQECGMKYLQLAFEVAL